MTTYRSLLRWVFPAVHGVLWICVGLFVFLHVRQGYHEVEPLWLIFLLIDFPLSVLGYYVCIAISEIGLRESYAIPLTIFVMGTFQWFTVGWLIDILILSRPKREADTVDASSRRLEESSSEATLPAGNEQTPRSVRNAGFAENP